MEPTRLFRLVVECAVPERLRLAMLGGRLIVLMTLRAMLLRFGSCTPMSGEPTPPPSL